MKALLNQRGLVLAIVIATAALGALAYGRQGHDAATPTDPTSASEVAAAAARGSPPIAQVVQGKVAEKIDVTQYSYLRLTREGGAEVWAAVPKADVAVGATVTVHDPQLMRGFTSSTLGRQFDEIYFGSLEASAGSGAGMPGQSPHGRNPNQPTGASGAVPPPSEGGSDPHRSPVAGGDDVKVGEVACAPGPNGRSIAEVYAQKVELRGKRVRVCGVVVKAVPGVLGRTFVHVRDGSGAAGQGTHDLTLTTTERPEPGQTVLYEGEVAVDRDFGSGYRYPVLIEDATSVTE